METRYSKKFQSFLEKVDKTPEAKLKKELFGAKNYIDTGGNYKEMKKHYTGIVSYEACVMGEQNFKKLHKWYKSHPKEVINFMKSKKKK